MNAYCAPASRPHPLYLVECDFGQYGRAFQETDRDDNSRVEIVRQIRNGSVNVIKVLEIDEQSGTCTDVTEDILAEAAEAREPPSLQDSFNRLEQLRDHNRKLRAEAS